MTDETGSGAVLGMVVRYGGSDFEVVGVWVEQQVDELPSLTIKAKAKEKPQPKTIGFKRPRP